MGAGKTFIMPHVSAIHNVKKQYIAFLNRDLKNTQIIYKKTRHFILTLENIS